MGMHPFAVGDRDGVAEGLNANFAQLQVDIFGIVPPNFVVGGSYSAGNLVRSGNGNVYSCIQPVADASLDPANDPTDWEPVMLCSSATVGTPQDYSANPPGLPNIGAPFGPSGPYANYVLVASVPASRTRHSIEVDNMSGAQIVLVRDDGTAIGGAAPANASLIALTGGAQAGAQGGSWSSTTFAGRLQVYAPSSGAQVSIYTD